MSGKNNFAKILKYDFGFSWKIFVAMFLGIIALTFAIDLTLDIPMYAMSGFRVFIMIAGITAVIIASYLQIVMFFHRNFFGPEGYLMLTLPASRSKMLVSKLLVSMVWFNFMLLLMPIMLTIIAPPMGDFWAAVSNILADPNIYVFLLYANFAALAALSLLFLTITASNSVLFNKKIHGVVAGILSAGLHFLLFWASARILERSWEFVRVTRGNSSWYQFRPQMGLAYGRIPLGQDYFGMPLGHLDIYFIAFLIGLTVIFSLATLYLFKKRLALR